MQEWETGTGPRKGMGGEGVTGHMERSRNGTEGKAEGQEGRRNYFPLVGDATK